MKLSPMLIITLFFLTGCMRFQPTKLTRTPHSKASVQKSSPLFTVSASVLTPPHIDVTASKITHDFVLVETSLTNKTSSSATLLSEMITPQIATRAELRAHIPRNYTCYYIPAIITGLGGFFFMWHIGLPLAGLFTLFGINQSRRAADRTAVSLNAHIIDPATTITIPPYSTQKFLLAWNIKNFAPHISFTMRQGDKDHVFRVELRKTLTHTYAFVGDV